MNKILKFKKREIGFFLNSINEYPKLQLVIAIFPTVALTWKIINDTLTERVRYSIEIYWFGHRAGLSLSYLRIKKRHS